MDVLGMVRAILTDTSVLLGIFILTLYLVLRQVVIDRSNGLPPGPGFRIPVIGNMYAVDRDMRKFLRRSRKKYGDIYSLYFGNKLVIIIAGFDKLKEAFVKNADVFSDRPKGPDIFSKIADGKGIVFIDGELWKEHRKFGLTTLRNFGMGKSVLENRIHSEVRLLLEQFKSQENQSFDPGNIIYVSVSNVLNALAFGKHFTHDDPRYAELIQEVKENFSNVGLSAVGSFVPALANLPGDLFKIKRSISNAATIRGFLREFVNEHLQSYDENNVEDYTGAFIKEMRKQSNDETTTFTIEQLVHVLSELFGAGTETTASILRWALVYLINFPDLQEQIYKDIVDKIGTNRLPSMRDRTKVPLIDAFMQECLRRSCLGEALARMEMYLFLGAIVQNFKISAPVDENLSLDTIDSFGISHIPKPYKIIATPRGHLST